MSQRVQEDEWEVFHQVKDGLKDGRKRKWWIEDNWPSIL